MIQHNDLARALHSSTPADIPAGQARVLLTFGDQAELRDRS
ncbi:hypothetical protein [Microbispora corallina]|nr:hypothetical protein [Microbispora corallina]